MFFDSKKSLMALSASLFLVGCGGGGAGAGADSPVADNGGSQNPIQYDLADYYFNSAVLNGSSINITKRTSVIYENSKLVLEILNNGMAADESNDKNAINSYSYSENLNITNIAEYNNSEKQLHAKIDILPESIKRTYDVNISDADKRYVALGDKITISKIDVNDTWSCSANKFHNSISDKEIINNYYGEIRYKGDEKIYNNVLEIKCTDSGNGKAEFYEYFAKDQGFVLRVSKDDTVVGYKHESFDVVTSSVVISK